MPPPNTRQPPPSCATSSTAFISRRVADVDTADDLTQEVLLKVHRAGHDIEAVDDVAAWIYRIARNTLIDHYRRRDRHPDPAELPSEIVALDLADDAALAREQLAGCLRPMVEALDPIYRDALARPTWVTSAKPRPPAGPASAARR